MRRITLVKTLFSWLLLVTFALATRLPSRADLGMLDPMAKPSTRLGSTYLLALNVSINGRDEAELCGQFPLDADASLALKIGQEPIDKIPLKGLTIDEAKARITAVIERYFAVRPDIKIGIARIPRIHVVINGATFRNGPMILADGSHLSDALAEAGYLPSADLKRVEITRTVPGGATTRLTADFTRFLEGAAPDNVSDPVLQNADRISLPLAPVLIDQTIAVAGEVRRPNPSYPWKKGMKVRDALEAALGMLPTADPQKVTISRRRDNSIMVVDAEKALQNIPTENLLLQPDDSLFIPTKDTGLRYSVIGTVAAPKTFDFTKPVTLKQAIIDSGGFRPNADTRHLVLMRNLLHDPTQAKAIPVDYERIARGDQPDFKLEPGDVIQVPEKKRPPSPLLELGLIILRHLIF